MESKGDGSLVHERDVDSWSSSFHHLVSQERDGSRLIVFLPEITYDPSRGLSPAIVSLLSSTFWPLAGDYLFLTRARANGGREEREEGAGGWIENDPGSRAVNCRLKPRNQVGGGGNKKWFLGPQFTSLDFLSYLPDIANNSIIIL